MTLQPGSRVGPYEILAAIGTGGMGEVWRARDHELEREVALKVLPEAFLSDTDRTARFEREAKILASMNHIHIGAIHGIYSFDGAKALVLELVEGPTLADRLVRGPIPLDEALPIARQIAEALEAAHETGIVHRDLKPANVKLRPDGVVKVLDFGLAKGLEPSPEGSDLTNSPTLTAATQLGVVLGTAAYMAPEQARGAAADKRADIWAFGCVLFEMLSGRRPFEGTDVADMLAAVLRSEPEWEKLPQNLPPSLERLLRRCLVKSPRQRLRDIGDARIEIEEIEAGADGNDPHRRPGRGAGKAPLAMLPWLAAGACLAVAFVAAWLWLREPTTDAVRPARLSMPIQPGLDLAVGSQRPAIALSADGRRVAYVAENHGDWKIYVRELDSSASRPIAGTESGSGPFFSPDGNWLGFFSGWKMMKVSLVDGTVVPISVVPPVSRGASWSDDDEIYFTSNPNGGISRVPATPGAEIFVPEQDGGWNNQTQPDRADDEVSHRWPAVLPGGKVVLYTVDSGNSLGSSRIDALDAESGRIQPVLDGAGQARYAAGYLVFVRGSALMAAAFDRGRLQVTSTPQVLVPDVAQEPDGAAHFAVAADGTLIFIAGGNLKPDRRLVWVDRQGTITELPIPARSFFQPSLSPEGDRLAVTVAQSSNYDIWLYDLTRNSPQRLTTHEGEDFNSVWTPDGLRIALSSEMSSIIPGLHWLSTNGNPAPEKLGPPNGTKVEIPGSFHPDGESLAYSVRDLSSPREADVMLLQLGAEPEARPLLTSDFKETNPQFSPDGRWLAYVSDESGQDEVYVRSHPEPERKYSVSAPGGGREPLWSPRGDEIFYRRGNALMAVALDAQTRATFSAPRELFAIDLPFTERPDIGPSYAVDADGQRFLMLREAQEEKLTEIGVVFGWQKRTSTIRADD